mgnify:CR=1 FL=1
MESKNKVIYFDNASTTKPLSEIITTFNNVYEQHFANPSSNHLLGSKAHKLLEDARLQLLKVFQCPNHKVIFTSGATEAINLAIKGYCYSHSNRGKHIITTFVEHPASLLSCKNLENEGFEVTYLKVNSEGKIDLNELKSSIKEDTILVSIMAVNNEMGTIYPIDEIADFLKTYPKVALFVDATQAIGKVKLDYNKIDMFAYSSHKINGLKGSGALILKSSISLKPMSNGGGQENGIRSGTNDLANACCTSKATRIALENIDESTNKVSAISHKIRMYVASRPDLYEINSPRDGSPFIFNFSLLNKKAAVLVEALSNQNIFISSTSACNSKYEAGSDVLKAMGKSEKLYKNTIRLSFDNNNTLEEADIFIKAIDKIMEEIKSD